MTGVPGEPGLTGVCGLPPLPLRARMRTVLAAAPRRSGGGSTCGQFTGVLFTDAIASPTAILPLSAAAPPGASAVTSSGRRERACARHGVSAYATERPRPPAPECNSTDILFVRLRGVRDREDVLTVKPADIAATRKALCALSVRVQIRTTVPLKNERERERERV